MSGPIKRRAVFFIGGYEKKSVEAFFARCDREIGRFEHLWSVDVGSAPTAPIEQGKGLRRYTAAGDGWRVATDVVFQSLDSVVEQDFRLPTWQRLWRFSIASADYLFTGTAFRFVRHAWRFSTYFFYPILMFWLALAISIGLAVSLFGIGSFASMVGSLVVFLAVFMALLRLGGQRYFVFHLMDLWSFSREYLRGQRADMGDVLDSFARNVVKQVQSEDYDEVILVGHSTGGALMLDAMARVVELDPDIADRARHISVMTVGSTALKIGLHPAAGWFRAKVRSVFENRGIEWLEFQCLVDLINFYRTDPARLMGLDLPPSQSGLSRPTRAHVRMSMMVSQSRYRRMRGNFFRIHYQFVYGNTRRYFYDFFAICLGPSALIERARHPRHFDQSIMPPENPVGGKET